MTSRHGFSGGGGGGVVGVFDFGFGGFGLFRFLFRSFRLFWWFRSGCSGGFVPVVSGFSTCVSYLIILTTKFVKLPILWSQISPCRPKTNFVKLFFLAFPCVATTPRPKQAAAPPQIFIHPPRTKV
jgi:hypothetical protein